MKSTAFDMAMVAYRQNDMEGAFRQFLSLAEAQDADAMNMAANMFERGQGTYRDPGRAVFWWKKAVELGNVDALADYGQYLVTVFFDGKEQKLGAGYLVTATERGNNRAGESLVEFTLKNNDAGAKVYRTAAEYCDRAIASATDSYLRTQYVQKKGMLKYKLRQHRIGNNYVYLAAVFSTIGAVLLIIASVDLFLELHMEFRDMFKLFSYSKMIPWEADIAMLFGAMLLFTLGKVTNKLHVASFLQLLASVFAVAVVAMHFICVINDGRVWYDKLLWYVVLVVIPLMLGKLLGEILRKIIGIQ